MPQYINEGDAIDYVAPADVTSGTIVDVGGNTAAIANTDIATGKHGSLQKKGVVEAPSNVAFTVDGRIGFNFTTQQFITYASGPSFLMREDTGRTDAASALPLFRCEMNRNPV